MPELPTPVEPIDDPQGVRAPGLPGTTTAGTAGKTGKTGKTGKARWFRHLSASSLGIEIALTIVLGWWGGRWLERNVTHWSPWTAYIGFFIGCGASILAIRRTVREYKAYLAEVDAQTATPKATPKAGPDA